MDSKVAGYKSKFRPHGFALFYLFAERGKRQCHHLEMLTAEGYAHDGYAQQDSEAQMRQRDPYPSHEKPYHVHQKIQAPVRFLHARHFAAERPQGEYRQFQCLQAERDAYYRYHHGHARYQIFQCHGETAAQQPNNISHCFHKYQVKD